MKKQIIIIISLIGIVHMICACKNNEEVNDLHWIINYLIDWDDLFIPVIKDDKYVFSKKGFSKTYKINPRYCGNYKIGIDAKMIGGIPRREFSNKSIPVFDVKIIVNANDIVYNRVLESEYADGFVLERKESIENEKFISYSFSDAFRIPVNGDYLYYRKELCLTITMINPIKYLKSHNGKVFLYIMFDNAL